MSSYKIEALPLTPKLIGEGPHWDASTQELLFVDILGKSVYRYNPATRQERKVVIDNGEPMVHLPFVIPVQSQPDKYLIAFGGSICLLEWPAAGDSETLSVNKLKTLHSVPVNDPPASLNDGKCDSKGRLWTGSLCVRALPDGWEVVKGVGHVYRLDLDGSFTSHVDDMDLSNGLAWSPDYNTLYYIDTGYPWINAFDYDLEKGTISNRRSVFNLKENKLEGMPDGMCTDADGNLWVAVYDGGKVIHVNPRTGKLLGSIDFGENKKITSCTFGGSNLDTLYVTSGKFGCSDEEAKATGAGSVYAVTGLGVKGVSAGISYAGKL